MWPRRILVVLVLTGIYAPVLADMGRAWWVHPYAGHGMFVPAFSAYVLWLSRRRLQAAVGRGHPAGGLLVLLGLGVLVLGRWGESLLIQGASLVITVAGLILWGFGVRCLRQAAFPVAFLLFMAPLPRALVDALTLDLQLFAAGFAGEVLERLDIPFYLHDQMIDLSTITLNVAEVCNGLRFLMALVTVTIAFAQLSQRSLPRKLLLVGSAVPIAILANAVRVAAIAAGVHYVGPEVASGPIHHLIAKAVWGLTAVLLVALGLVLRWGGRAGSSEPGRLAVQEPGGAESAR
jgi:exosortase